MPAPNDPRLIDKDATHLFSQLKKLDLEKIGLDFMGSSPPELFVGRYNYPHVYTGILAPTTHDDSSYKLSYPEQWFKERMSITKILNNRGTMVYSRFHSNVKKPNSGKLLGVMQEVSMAKKPCDVEFFLKKKPRFKMEMDARASPVGNPAPLEKARLTENPSVHRKVDYVVSDTDLKAKDAILDLYSHNFQVSSLIKLLSAGLLGIKPQRILVPSRWSVTAVDDMISKNLYQRIKHYDHLDTIQVFHDEYLGNHYEFLLLPREWSFEVMEAKQPPPGADYHPLHIQDYENYYGKKGYADSVTGAYYANRLAVCEYLENIKKQASVLVMREIRPEYYASLGVGILREVSRNAFKKKPEEFETVMEAATAMQKRMNLPVYAYLRKSLLLKDKKEQTTLKQFFR